MTNNAILCTTTYQKHTFSTFFETFVTFFHQWETFLTTFLTSRGMIFLEYEGITSGLLYMIFLEYSYYNQFS